MRYCQLCGQALTGQGQVFRHPDWPAGMGMRVCVACAGSSPRCRQCGLPLVAETPAGLCLTCTQSAGGCLACGRPCPPGDLYCAACLARRPTCDTCGAPLTADHWRLSDGRLVCGLCQRSAVYEAGLSRRLYSEMCVLVQEGLGLALNIPTGLALVDQNTMGELIRSQAGPVSALSPERTLGLYARRGLRRGIYVQTGLPRRLFLQVAAHEYAHAWQGEACPALRRPIPYEGFAEWLAYWVIGQTGDQPGQALMLRRTDGYGEGLRWALEIERHTGPQGVIDAVRALRA